MNKPLEIMDAVEAVLGAPPSGEGDCWTVTPREWQSLRTALERQAEELEGRAHDIDRQLESTNTLEEELAQKDARIVRLETGAVLAIQSLRDRWQAGGTALLVASGLQDVVNESPAQSAAHLKAEALREFSEKVYRDRVNHDDPDPYGFAAYLARLEADRIEREAKEES